VRTSDFTVKLSVDGRSWPEGVFFKVIYHGSIVPMYLPGIIGEHSIYRASAAIAVALVFGMNLVEISSALRNVTMPPGRMRLIRGIKDTLIIDDSYNASPLAMRAALETLSRIQIAGDGERYAVIGDMLELGQQTQNSHREVGLRVGELGIDFLITVGEAMKDAAMAAKEAGMPENSIVSFNTAEEAGRFLQEKMQSGDIILVKGSRAMHMELVVREVMAEPEKAEELLVH
jgi:UDP-N-acetylmuramoyl-tripeptide--D-alanyl-D-alanine ligase